MLGDLEPVVPLDDEAGLHQGLEGFLDALRGGPQKLRELFGVRGISPDVGQDAEQLVEGDGLGPEVGHPADVEPGAFSPRPRLPRRYEPDSLHPESQYSGHRSVSLRVKLVSQSARRLGKAAFGWSARTEMLAV